MYCIHGVVVIWPFSRRLLSLSNVVWDARVSQFINLRATQNGIFNTPDICTYHSYVNRCFINSRFAQSKNFQDKIMLRLLLKSLCKYFFVFKRRYDYFLLLIFLLHWQISGRILKQEVIKYILVRISFWAIIALC